MNLFFLRHGKAHPRSPQWRPDSNRPLTREGENGMFEVARGIKSLDVSFDVILTSPFDRALRTVEEYNEKVEYIHQNPVRAGLVSRPQDWRWSSFNEYAGLSPAEQIERCGLIIDRIRIPSDLRTRI